MTFIKKHYGKIIIGLVILGILYYFLVYKKKTESSYTKYNDNNFPGLVSFATAPRETGNDIADIQLQRMAEKNPIEAATIES